MNYQGYYRLFRNIVSECGTPVYIYLQSVLDAQLDALRRAVAPDTLVVFSMKANPNPALVRHFAQNGCGVDVASAGELAIALREGVSSEKIVFSGPGKTDDDLRFAVKSKILSINVESINEGRRLQEICREQSTCADISIRINPEEGVSHAGVRMGGRESQFGIDEKNCEEAIAIFDRLPNIRLIGLHAHIATQVLNAKEFANYARRILEKGRLLAETRDISIINVGGGMGVPYFDGQKRIDLDLLAEVFSDTRRQLKGERKGRVTLMIESGRFLTAEAGFYLAMVVDVKVSRDRHYVVLDGGTNHRSEMTGILGAIRRNYRMSVLREEGDAETIEAEIVGPLCTATDKLGGGVRVPIDTRRGDLFVIGDSGAYCRNASPLNFLSHDWPPEVLVTRDGQHHCISERLTALDILNTQEQKRRHASTDGNNADHSK